MSLPRVAFAVTVASLLVLPLTFRPTYAQREAPSVSSSVSSKPAFPRSPAARDTVGPSPASPPPSSWNQVSVWMGGSSLNGDLIGKVPDSAIGMVGLRYEHRLAPAPTTSSSGLTYTYLAEVMPVVVLSVPSGIPFRTSGDEVVSTKGTTAYGMGVSPIGLRLTYQRASSRVAPFVATSTGWIFFTDPFPDARGKQFNFTVDAGVGLRIGLTSTTALTVGYRYHHLSNGFRGEINPGIDSHLFRMGVTVVH